MSNSPPLYLTKDINKIIRYAQEYDASNKMILKIIKDKAMQTSIATGNFIVGSIREDGSLSFSDRPAVHLTAVSAKKEVERLLGITPDVRYAYLELKGVAYAKGVCWDPL